MTDQINWFGVDVLKMCDHNVARNRHHICLAARSRQQENCLPVAIFVRNLETLAVRNRLKMDLVTVGTPSQTIAYPREETPGKVKVMMPLSCRITRHTKTNLGMAEEVVACTWIRTTIASFQEPEP